MDAVTFTVTTNPGAPPGALNRIASGGELSRFLLALKVCLHGQGAGQTLIFDEIDRGVGGPRPMPWGGGCRPSPPARRSLSSRTARRSPPWARITGGWKSGSTAGRRCRPSPPSTPPPGRRDRPDAVGRYGDRCRARGGAGASGGLRAALHPAHGGYPLGKAEMLRCSTYLAVMNRKTGGFAMFDPSEIRRQPPSPAQPGRS